MSSIVNTPFTPPLRRLRLAPARIARPATRETEVIRRAPPPPPRVPRVFTAEELVDRATIETAIDEIFARAQDACNPRRPVGLQLPNGPQLVGCAGNISRMLTKNDLIDGALAEKTVASRLAGLTTLDTPLAPILFFNLNPSTTASPGIDIQPPTIEEGLAAKVADLNKIQPFNFRKLPFELRQMIYPQFNNLAIEHAGQAPALVLALARDEELGPEIIALYKKINCSINLKNEDNFGKKRLKDLLVYNNIYMEWGAKATDQACEFLQLKAHKVQIMNNFRSLTMNYNIVEPCNFALLQQIARASSGVSRIAVRLCPAADTDDHPPRISDERISDFTTGRMRLIQHGNDWIHTPGRLSRVTTGTIDEEWFWEAPDCKFLDIEHPGRRKVAKATGGNMTLEDRIAGRSVLVQ